MKKKKNRTKENNLPGERGMFYCQKKCFICGKLIWGSSSKNHRSASKDCYFRMKAHQEEHQKQGKQLNLSMPDTEQKQSQTIRRFTLRGQVK